jgi:hypothetical protein
MADGSLDPQQADAALNSVVLALLKHRERVVSELQKRGADQVRAALVVLLLLLLLLLSLLLSNRCVF